MYEENIFLHICSDPSLIIRVWFGRCFDVKRMFRTCFEHVWIQNFGRWPCAGGASSIERALWMRVGCQIRTTCAAQVFERLNQRCILLMMNHLWTIHTWDSPPWSVHRFGDENLPNLIWRTPSNSSMKSSLETLREPWKQTACKTNFQPTGNWFDNLQLKNCKS